ncbi:MAG: pyridoxal phosphate-dependent aminotransferase [Acidobacteriota bacterium]
MSVSRRAFVKTLGVGGAAAAILSYDGPRAVARAWAEMLPEAERPLLLHNNENPLGPGPKVLETMGSALGHGAPAGRYPFGIGRELAGVIARAHGVSPDNVMIGNGSTQLLRSATHVFTSKLKPLVSGSPSYEECAGYAKVVGHPVVPVPLDDWMKLDLDAMADAARGAGMVFLNNPNNPTATLHSADAIGACVERVLSETPDTRVLIDEAYHDYVTDTSHRTQIPLAAKNKRVLVARTFSKAHGMAGMRIGFVVGHPEALATMRKWHYGLSLNVLALAGASVSMKDRVRIEKEQQRNTEARRFTLDWFKARGFEATDSQTNFIFVKTGVPAKQFRQGCLEHAVRVGRNFPPYEKAWARVSIGTLEEMRRATRVFAQVLGVAAEAVAA